MTFGSKGGETDDAAPARDGLWEPVIQLPNVPVHTHLLASGKVLFWGVGPILTAAWISMRATCTCSIR